MLEKKQVATYADFTGAKEADVEDMLERDFYVQLVNAEFVKQLKKPINASSLNSSDPRILRTIEEWLQANPLKSGKFGHYRPARYFVENVATLWPTVATATKDRLEAAFRYLNGLL